MRKIILLFTALLFIVSSYVAYGQSSTHEKPVSIKTSIPPLTRNEMTQKVMPYLNMQKIEQEDKEDEEKGIIPRFGFKHQVSYNLTNSGEWFELPDGDMIWRLTIFCPNASSINLLYDRFWIPEGAKFFIYSNDYQYYLGAFTSKNNRGTIEDPTGFATALIFSDKITLEYYLPKEAEDMGTISISDVVHGYRGCLDPNNPYGYGCSNPGHTNINCPEVANWQNDKDAVVMIIANGDRNCSGALVNTTSNGNNNHHYILTANHCLVSGNNVSNWLFCWHYESPFCDNTSYEPPIIVPSTLGATVVARSSYADFALLELGYDPAEEWDVTPYYLGWDNSGNVVKGTTMIHHPMGDIKKILQYSSAIESICSSYPNLETHWLIFASVGLIPQAGSSGAPVLSNNHKVIGEMSGTREIPVWGHGSYYEVSCGKFSWAWEGYKNPSSAARLKDWLDPINRGDITLDGRGCQKTIRLRNQHVPQTKTYHAVETIISEQAIYNGRTVTYKAGDAIVLQAGEKKNFHAHSGSNFHAQIEELVCDNPPLPLYSTQGGEYQNDNSGSSNFSLPQSKISPKINLHPNPNNGSFNIETNFPLTDIGNLKITNLMGAPVYETQKVTSNTVQLQIPAKGTYFVVMILKDGSVLTQKMVVQ